MIGVCAEKDNEIEVRWEDGSGTRCSTESFFTETLFEIIDSGSNTIYFKDLKTWGLAIIYKLNEDGFADDTEYRLVNNKNSKVKAGHYYYTVGERGGWFNIDIGGAEKDSRLLICAYENFVPISEEMLIEDFCEGEDDLDDIVAGMLFSISMMQDIGCTQNTVSSSATSLWRATYNQYDFVSLFRNIKGEEYDFIRSAYHGGFCYVNREGKAGEGVVLDVNGLYSWVMSECHLPIGKGKKFEGEPKELWNKDKGFGYFVRFTCRFKVKKGYIPFVRISNSNFYGYGDILSTSDIYNPEADCYCDTMVDTDTGEIIPVRATLTMWKDEYLLFREHYDVEDLHFIGGYKYMCWDKVFSKYVNRFAEMKENARNKSEKRIAKIMMNALSGNLAKNRIRDSIYFNEFGISSLGSFGAKQKELHTSGRRTAATTDDWGRKTYLNLEVDEVVRMISNKVTTESRSRSYINLGAAITSIGMVTVVRAAQKNYEHFLYTDTDSLHLDCRLEDVVGVEIDDKKLGKWKVEHEFYDACYIQQKIYYVFDKKDGCIVKWAGMMGESQRLLEECISLVRAGGFDNPWIKSEVNKIEETSEWEWESFMKALKKNKTTVLIPNHYYEMVDFKHFKKSLIDRRYRVDISQFV